jgi:hypothetical protein
MLSMLSSDTADAGTRMAHNQLAVAACPLGRVDAAREFGGGSVVFARPRRVTGAGVPGLDLDVAASRLPQGQPSVRQQYLSKTHLNKARSAAAIGGISGPHPARDPV